MVMGGRSYNAVPDSFTYKMAQEALTIQRSGQPLNILVVGAVRSEPDFSNELLAITKLFSQCKTGKLIICTWVDSVPMAHKTIESVMGDSAPSQLRVIGLKPLEFDFRGNWLRQSRLLYMGLEEFASDDYVLKMRTDKTSWVSTWAPALPIILSDLDTDERKFVSKVLIPTALGLEPFFYNDMAFAGLAKNLEAIVPSSLIPVQESWIVNPEQLFHGNPFIRRGSPLIEFFRRNMGLPHSLNEDELIQRARSLVSTSLMREAIMFSLHNLRDNYVFAADVLSPAEPKASTLDDHHAPLTDDPWRSLCLPPSTISEPHLAYNEGAKSVVLRTAEAVTLFERCLEEASKDSVL